MKIRITQKGVFNTDGEVDVGTVISFKGDTIPAVFVGKCEVVSQDPSEDQELKAAAEKEEADAKAKAAAEKPAHKKPGSE